MGKTRNTGYLGNIVTYDASNNIVLPALLTIGTAPDSSDNSGKVPSTAWVRNYVTNLGYQSVLTLTTTGSSGAATLVGNTLNIPNYTLNGLGGEPAVTAGTSSQYYRGDKTFQTLNTTAVAEGTNLYYTDARVGSYLTTNSYATQTYVNTQVSNLVNSAPATLDTLNELATALGNDPNFATTIATSIGTKLPLAGGTLTGGLSGTTATFTGNVSSATEFRLGASFARVATLDAGGGFGGGYNFNWSNGTPIHDSTGALSGIGYANDGSLRFYTNTSSAANTTAPQRFTISAAGAATFYGSLSGTSATFSGVITSQANGSTFGTSSAAGRAVTIQAGSTNQAIRFLNSAGGDGTISATGTSTTMNYSFSTYATSDALYISNNGYIGVGNNAPSGKLHVTVAETASQTTGFKVVGDTNSKAVVLGANTDYVWIQSHGSVPLRINELGNNLILGLGANVGIGNATVSDKLDVYGTIRSSVNTNYYTTFLYSGGTSIQMYSPVAETSDNMTFVINGAGSGTTGNGFLFKTQSGNTTPVTTFWINKLGDVSIGTTTSTKYQVLNLINDANTSGAAIGLARSAGQFLTTASAGDMFIGNATNKNILFGNAQTGTTEYARITSGGRLQITTNGSYSSAQNFPLTINTSTGTSSGIQLTVNQSNYAYILNDGTNLILGSDAGATGQKIKIHRNTPDSSLIINSSGNFGINETSPGYKLDVNGDSRLRDTVLVGSNVGLMQLAMDGTRIYSYPYTEVHIKTSILKGSDTMIAFNLRGYTYSPDIIDTDVGFYLYQPVNYVYGVQIRHKGVAITVGMYYSTDNYVCFYITGLGTYGGVVLNWINTSLIQWGAKVTILGYTRVNSTSPQF